ENTFLMLLQVRLLNGSLRSSWRQNSGANDSKMEIQLSAAPARVPKSTTTDLICQKTHVAFGPDSHRLRGCARHRSCRDKTGCRPRGKFRAHDAPSDRLAAACKLIRAERCAAAAGHVAHREYHLAPASRAGWTESILPPRRAASWL